MSYRNKIYVCFDGDKDIHYFFLLKAWTKNQNDFFKEFNFFDAHEMNYARDDSQEETIKKKLKERLNNSKLLIVLVGESTKYLYKFVRWEMEQAIKMNIPIVAVNLNGKRSMDEVRCPSIIQNELVLHISFNQKIIEKAINEWIDIHNQKSTEGIKGPFYYKDSVYENLGL